MRAFFRPCFLLILFALRGLAEDVVPSTYLLGPDDQVSLRSLRAQEISDKPMRIDPEGFIRLPLIGRIKAAGLTTSELEQSVTERLKAFYLDPDISVNVTEYRSQPISVMGAVKTPGVLQLQGQKTLVEILSMAGGMAPDAGNRLAITRQRSWGPPPVNNARLDPRGEYYVAEVDLTALMDAKDPYLNFTVFPRDVITIPRAPLVYVLGEVHKSGGFVLRDDETISVLQALSMAEGLSSTAGPKNARILRPQAEGKERMEIAINLKRVLAGQDPDFRMLPNDILLVPNSIPKSATLRSLEAAFQIGTGVAIWRPYR